MRQYVAIKQQNPTTVLLYRMGDFYEMFNEDAKTASRILGLTLTSRNHGGADATPLAGFPYHALDRYANRLVKAGYRIAICEQTEDPKKAKGLVKRDVIEIISAGTATETSFIDEKSNNYILGIVVNDGTAGVSICDLSTGEFSVEEIEKEKLSEEIVRVDPAEIIAADGGEDPLAGLSEENGFAQRVITRYDGWKFDRDNAEEVLKCHFSVASLQGLGFESYETGIRAAGALLSYLKEQKKNDLRHISSLIPRTLSRYAELDPSTIRNLELLKPIHSDDKGGTLISVLDRTCTAMGGRLMKRWITHPLKQAPEISDRLDCVEWLKKDVFVRGEIELLLKQIFDIERLIGRITYERANARDLSALKNSLNVFPKIVKTLSPKSNNVIRGISQNLEGFEDLALRIDETIVDNPPLSLREGGIIRKGVSQELDEIKEASQNGKKWIASLQETERKNTGISSLKIGFNKVFGYYIEVSKANISLVPETYIRKQTLVNGERFITPELKEMEEKILGAEERLSSLEYELFVSLRTEIAGYCSRIQKAAEAVAMLDVFTSLAKIAADSGYCRPIIREDSNIIIRECRHPVIEQMSIDEQFVPNDAIVGGKDAQIILITGPNMAGKSTYLRQNALIAIMAQMGSFVPAAKAEIGIVDKFFTRVGASDRLARGQSTFLVEMIEVANILNNATDRSLVLLDEVGRGTSTFDGISIAWAVAEHLHKTPKCRPRTFFATHYHELTELALLFPRIKNMHVKVKEWNDKIIFVRKVEDGSCDHSYGIQVARLAGVPEPVIKRAKEILANLESMELTPDHKPALARHDGETRTSEPTMQTDLFFQSPQVIKDPQLENIKKKLDTIEINNLTPIEALNHLAEIKKAVDTPPEQLLED
ncbi:MAG: DNA mismatch repair protein MutS [Chitinivibrionales bacterium]|nr:DNA mismatch repair protein MutS [Chitinivibrionales bacterium]